ncbi:Chitin synthase, class 5 [Lecanora helva]
MLISLTVGKVDAGVAVLLTEDKRLIEFPSILLPPSITSGSVVDINVARNTQSEIAAQKSFTALQDSILNTYGLASPSPPVIRCRNATQTSVVLEWDAINLATADLRSLTLYRNGAKAGVIPQDKGIQATKVSGLAVDTEYTFHLMLRTSAGQYSSEKLVVKTHKMTDLSGITVTPGALPAPLRESLAGAVDRIGAKIADTVRIDTTHFVCTEGRGHQWERAVEMNIPIVRPEWVEGCEREGRIVGVRGYYLDADPKLRQVGQGVAMQQQPQQRPQHMQRNESNQAMPIRQQQQPQQSPPAQVSNSQLPPPTPSPRPSTGGSEPPPPLPAKDTPAAPEPVSPDEESDDARQHGRAEGREEDAPVSPISDATEGAPKESRTASTDEKEEPETPGSFSTVQL